MLLFDGDKVEMVGEHFNGGHLPSNWIIEGRSVKRPWRDTGGSISRGHCFCPMEFERV